MFDFIADNLATILIGLAVLAVIALIVANMVKKKRRGQVIGCGCSGCTGCGAGAAHSGRAACGNVRAQ
jgi:hypothetical protein